MVYWDDQHHRPQHQPIFGPNDPLVEPAEPTIETRTRVRAHIKAHPNRINQPSRIEAHLRRVDGFEASLEQIAGALAEIRAEQQAKEQT